MANRSFFQTATSTKWQPWRGNQPSLSHLDSKSFETIFEHASPIFTMFYFIFILLLDTCGGFWWCEGGICRPNGWVVVWLWPSRALQNGNPTTSAKSKPRAWGCFPANYPTKPQQHHLQTKTACTHSRCVTTRLWGKDLHHVPLPKNARTRHCQLRSIKLFSLQNEPPQWKNRGP